MRALAPPAVWRLRAPWLAGIATAMGILAACEASPPPRRRADRHDGEEPRTPTRPRTGDDEREAAPPADDDRCMASEPTPLGVVPARSVVVAASEAGRLLVLDTADGGLVVLHAARGAGASGAVTRREIPRARGERVFVLESAGDRFLLLGAAPCNSAGVATDCLVVRSISAADGITSGPPVEVALPARIRTMRVFASGPLLYVARSHADAPPGLERFEARGDGTVTHVRRALGDALPPGEPVEILGLTADGAGWAVVYRHGATEDAESAVVLATQLDEHEIGDLHDALLVESMAWVGTSLAMIVAFEFARPSWVRVGADGEVITAPRALPPGGEAPVPFAGRRTAHVVGDASAREIEIRDAMGDRFGAHIVLGTGTADVAHEGDGFVVARLAENGAVSVRAIACP